MVLECGSFGILFFYKGEVLVSFPVSGFYISINVQLLADVLQNRGS